MCGLLETSELFFLITQYQFIYSILFFYIGRIWLTRKVPFLNTSIAHKQPNMRYKCFHKYYRRWATILRFDTNSNAPKGLDKFEQ